MYNSRIKFGVFFLILIFGQLAKTDKLWCTPDSQTLTECNWCWCIGTGVPVCTTLDCKRVPKDLWGTLQLSKKQKAKRCLIIGSLLAISGFLVVRWIGAQIFAKIESFISSAFSSSSTGGGGSGGGVSGADGGGYGARKSETSAENTATSIPTPL